MSGVIFLHTKLYSGHPQARVEEGSASILLAGKYLIIIHSYIHTLPF